MRRDKRPAIPFVLHSPALTRSPGVAGIGSMVSSPLSECETALLPCERVGVVGSEVMWGNLKTQSQWDQT